MILEVIDSSKNRLKQTDVLRRIRNANVLLQVSKSEGSGLPILEALGLGTQVLTTPVGISKEILSISSDRNFTSRNVDEVHQKLHQLVKDAKISDRALYVKTFEEYVQSASVEGIPKGIHRQIISEEYTNWSRTIPVQIAWIIRYFRELFV
jgi:glycosyltransferase involved in cell wall biosynthesis